MPMLPFLPAVERLLTDPAVLFVGDAIIDEWQVTDSPKVNPESGCLTLPTRGPAVALPGGVGNAATRLERFPARTHLITVAPPPFWMMLRDLNLQITLLKTNSGEYAPVKTRYHHQGHILARVDTAPGKSSPEDSELVAQAWQHATARLDTVQAVVVSDYRGPMMKPELLTSFLAAARKRSLPVVVDTKLLRWGIDYRGSILKLNAQDACRLTTAATPWEACEAISRLTATTTVVTCGRFPPWLCTRPGPLAAHSYGPTFPHWQPFDASGAGDTFAAFFALSRACGMADETAADIAHHAAATGGRVPVRRSPIFPSELNAALGGPGKIFESDLLDWVRTRTPGTLAVCNGCFDLLHPGHLATLRHARSLADHVLVLVNSDASVRRLKGNARPIHPLTTRLEVLGALDLVDAVSWFSEETPANVLQSIVQARGRKIDVLVKGGDYQGQPLSGEEYAAAVSWGPLIADQSTTRTVTSCQAAGSAPA